MKKILALFAGFLLLIGCTANPYGPTSYATVRGPANPVPGRTVTLLLDNKAAAQASAAAYFCEKVSALSNGSLTITVVQSGDAAADFKAENARLLLIYGENAVRLHPWFGILNEPFRYKSYEHFSMACNAKNILQRLSDMSGQAVLAGYYTGSNAFLSYYPITAIKADPDEAEPAGEVFPQVVTIPGTVGRQLAKLGLLVDENPSLAERINMHKEHDSAIEITYEELASGLMDEHGLTLTKTYHNIVPLWLIASPAFLQELTPVEQAAILEAAACLTSKIDGAYLQKEQDAIRKVEALDYEVTTDFTANRTKIVKAIARTREKLDVGEKNFRDLLDKINA